MTVGMKIAAFTLSCLLATTVGDKPPAVRMPARDVAHDRSGANSGIGRDTSDPSDGKAMRLTMAVDPIVGGGGSVGALASRGSSNAKVDTAREMEPEDAHPLGQSSSSATSILVHDPSAAHDAGRSLSEQPGSPKDPGVTTTSNARQGLRGLSVQRLLPYFRTSSGHSKHKQSKQRDRHPSKSYPPPKTHHGYASNDDDDCDNNSSSKGKGGPVNGKTKGKTSYKSLKGHKHSKKSQKASSTCKGKGCAHSKSKSSQSSKSSTKCGSGRCGPSKTKSSKASTKASSKCGSGTGSCGGMMSPKSFKTSSPPPVKCPTAVPTSNIIEDRCEKECMDWVYENCVVLDEMGNVVEEHCVVPFPFDDDLYGRSLMAAYPFATPDEELQYHKRMIGIYESVLSLVV